MLRKAFAFSVAIIALAGSAFAADMPAKAPAYQAPVPMIYNWTGLYVGGQIGGVWAHDSGSIVNPGIPVAINVPFAIDASGVIGGGHIGYNWQFGQWVLGVEGSADWTNLNKDSIVGVCPLFCAFTNTKSDWRGSARGRAGWAFDRFLVYATGGWAVAHITNTYNTTPFGGGFASISRTQNGWTAGGGIDYAIDKNWSLLAEFRYSDFGKFTDQSSVAFFPATTVNHHVTEVQGQVGFSYKFDGFGS